MNVSTGGPHILLFERDQQLAALLSSEFQLAGYEFHVARTAVEVFDAIARHTVRLVMVNLAQAAASRREFWVALDAQRRGRGVQVFTFRCINLAGYGPHDPDDHARTMSADMEVDGMLGIMGLVDAVRTRVPLPGQSTSAPGRFSNTAGTPSQPLPAVQVTVPVASVSPNASGLHPVPTPPLNSQPTAAPANHNFTDKIRAVIYPNSRSFSSVPQQEPVWGTQTVNGQMPFSSGSMPPPPASPNGPVMATPSTPRQQPSPSQPVYPRAQPATTNGASGEQYATQYPPQYASQPQYSQGTQSQQPAPAHEDESSLAQLTRLLQEQFSSVQERSQPQDRATAYQERSSAQQVQQAPAYAPQEQSPIQQAPMYAPQERSPIQQTYAPQERSAIQEIRQEPQMQARPPEVQQISAMPLRASPIQDIPLGRGQEQRSDRFDTRSTHTYGRYPSASAAPATELNSIKMVIPPSPSPMAPLPQSVPEPVQASPDTAMLSYTEKKYRERGEDTPNAIYADAGQEQETNQYVTGVEEISTDTTLLDIMQSLPPMSPAPPPPVLNGRATRALGNVLLEGHLVPQDRLEVAQSVQRMLRGVDLNYQLGEILLMFKLLTPDQLLAASLVSYGLISTAQIRSLGRIRQELHSIGLEYDLENLIILFRILSPEQLREVRSSWSA